MSCVCAGTSRIQTVQSGTTARCLAAVAKPQLNASLKSCVWWCSSTSTAHRSGPSSPCRCVHALFEILSQCVGNNRLAICHTQVPSRMLPYSVRNTALEIEFVASCEYQQASLMMMDCGVCGSGTGCTPVVWKDSVMCAISATLLCL